MKKFVKRYKKALLFGLITGFVVSIVGHIFEWGELLEMIVIVGVAFGFAVFSPLFPMSDRNLATADIDE